MADDDPDLEQLQAYADAKVVNAWSIRKEVPMATDDPNLQGPAARHNLPPLPGASERLIPELKALVANANEAVGEVRAILADVKVVSAALVRLVEWFGALPADKLKAEIERRLGE